MVPKKKEYSHDLRETVIKHFLNGDSEHEMTRKVLIPGNSVHYIIAKYTNTKCIGDIIGHGRKRKTSEHLDRVIQQKIKVDRRKSASSVKVEVETEPGLVISEQTVRRRMHEVGLHGREARKKPYVSNVNRGKRLEYAKNYREKPLSY
jgi:transposase